MPNSAPHKCSTPGCRNLSRRGKCDACKGKPKYRRVSVYNGELMDAATATQRIAAAKHGNARYAHATKMRNNKAFKKLREWIRTVHPLCYNPLGLHTGHPPRMQHVHHIVSIVDSDEAAFDASNCVPVCRRCHGMVEAMTRAKTLPASTWQRWREFIDEVAV